MPAGIVVNVPTLIDRSLAPAGEHLVTVTALVPDDVAASWRGAKEPYLEALREKVCALIPGIGDHLTFAEGGSPRTLERYTLNLVGAMYGWAPSPEQAGANRPGHGTPLAGLYLAGHWTRPGGGVMAAVVSGLQAAQLVLGYPSMGRYLEATAAA